MADSAGFDATPDHELKFFSDGRHHYRMWSRATAVHHQVGYQGRRPGISRFRPVRASYPVDSRAARCRELFRLKG